MSSTAAPRLLALGAAFVLGGAASLAAQERPAGLTEREITVPGPVPLPGTHTLPAGKGGFPGDAADVVRREAPHLL